jgi:hypothetical protein
LQWLNRSVDLAYGEAKLAWDTDRLLLNTPNVIADLYSIEQSAAAKCRQVLALFPYSTTEQYLTYLFNFAELAKLLNSSTPLRARAHPTEKDPTLVSSSTTPPPHSRNK